MTDKNFPADFTANATPLATDYVITSTGGTSGRKTLISDLATMLATSLPLAPVIAEQETTTAPFATSQTLPAPEVVLSAGLASGSLVATADAGAPGGFKYTLSAATSAAFGLGIWWLDMVIPVGRYVLSGFVYVPTPAGGDSCLAGVAFIGDATAGTALVYATGYDATTTKSTVFSRADGPGSGALLDSDASGALGFFEFDITVSTPSSNPPGLLLRREFMELDGTRYEGGTNTAIIEGVSTWPAVWDTSDCNRIGLVLQSPDGSAAPISAQILNLKVTPK